MHKISLTICLLGCALVSSAVFAHGGIEKGTDNVTIFISQSPISPLVGEKVKFTFVLAPNSNKLERLRNLEVNLLLVDTFYGNEANDRTILKEKKVTDVNGGFEFEYTFNKENYFDIDLSFVNPVTNKEESMGFLIQPRETPESKSQKIMYSFILVSAFTGFLGGFWINKRKSH